MTLYTSKVIAQWLCLTERRVRQLRDEGVIVEARPGLYDLQPTVARYIKYLGGAGKESLNTERMKLTAEKRKAAEMDNDLRRGDLHSTQDIEKGIQTMCLNIRSRFLANLQRRKPDHYRCGVGHGRAGTWRPETQDPGGGQSGDQRHGAAGAKADGCQGKDPLRRERCRQAAPERPCTAQESQQQ